MSLESFRLNEFSGGMNDLDPAYKMGPNECTWNSHDLELQGGAGVIGSRRGVSIFPTSAALPSSGVFGARISNLKTYRRFGGPGDLLIMSNDLGAIYRCDPNSVAGTLTIVLAPAATAEYDFIQAQDSGTQEYVWCLNGFSTPQKFNVDTSVLSAWGGTPPNGKTARVWKNRMVVTGVAAQPQRLYYSTIANPESWPVNNFIDIKSTDDEQEPITAIEVVEENLLVFKEKSVWLVFDPVSFENRRIGDVGCVGRLAVARSVASSDERVYWVSRTGVYSTDGDKVQYESRMIEPRFQDASVGWTQWFYTFKDKTKLTMLQHGKLFLVNWDAMGFSRFSTVLVMDTKYSRPDGQKPWFRHTGVMSGITAITPVHSRDHDINSAEVDTAIAVLDINNPVAGSQVLADILRDDRVKDSIAALNDTQISGIYESPFLPVTQSTEKMERIRRFNLHGDRGTVTLNLQADEGTNASFGPSSLAVAQRFVRFRPELRGRFFQATLDFRDGGRMMEMEWMYRGGKEH
jgi:hypothetical protein